MKGWVNREREEEDARVCLGRVRDVLQVLHMDSEDMVWRCVENYNRLYWWRRQRAGFKRTVHKENVALAAAIWKQMIRTGMPRPIQHVVRLCGLENGGPLLRVKWVLNFSKEEEEELVGWYEYEEAPPQDYLWTLCAYLSLPFWLPACAAQLLVDCKVRRELRGGNPVHIAAGCLVSVAGKFGGMFDGEVGFDSVCSTLGCSVKPVQRVVDRIPAYELEFEQGVEEVGYRWLMLRGRSRIKASQVKPRLVEVKKEAGGGGGEEDKKSWNEAGVRVEFRKSERMRLAEEKRKVYRERVAQRKHASEKRWKHLTQLTSWLQGELGKNGCDLAAQTSDRRSAANSSPVGQGTAHAD